LRNGVGIYAGSFVPGYGGTILVAGHNNTYFNGLKNAAVGQKVEIKTSYGNYIYEITDTAVKKATDRTAYDLSADYENLIMYTCYPFDALGLTTQRYFVYAKLVSGTPIDKEAN
ncbi:MAG TPA: class D sortase, partial [Ruminococcus bromii]|nr:class D sortase [Ruminococcus bromii]